MSVISVTTDMWNTNRARTLATLDEIAQLADPQAVLSWRPAPGRAHVAWQLMHIGITEELFATERLVGTAPGCPSLVGRFRGGSTPDDDIPNVDEIHDVLDNSRGHLLTTISMFDEADLDAIPEHWAERGLSFGQILQVIAWHEAHHQGQAHLTLNLWKATDQKE